MSKSHGKAFELDPLLRDKVRLLGKLLGRTIEGHYGGDMLARVVNRLNLSWLYDCNDVFHKNPSFPLHYLTVKSGILRNTAPLGDGLFAKKHQMSHLFKTMTNSQIDNYQFCTGKNSA